MTTSERNWCAVIQYPGKNPILFGHACVDGRAAHRDVEAELTRCIGRCLPDGWKMIDMIPGVLVFNPEQEEPADAPAPPTKPNDGTRRTFVIPDGHYPVLDEDGRATGEVLPLPAPVSQNNGSEK